MQRDKVLETAMDMDKPEGSKREEAECVRKWKRVMFSGEVSLFEVFLFGKADRFFDCECGLVH